MGYDYFEDYYDSEGNLHIDNRKPHKKVSETKNLRFKCSPSSQPINFQETKKLVIHHCNLVD